MSKAILTQLVETWKANPNEDTEKAVLDFMETPAYTDMEYVDRNELFITSSKLKLLETCELFAKYKYEDKVESPLKTSDALTIGSALDVLKTYGEEAYREKYAVVETRVSDVPAAIAEQEAKREEASMKRKKDGTMSLTAMKTVAACDRKIAELKNVVGKTQLTYAQGDLILQMAIETLKHPLFPKTFKKRNIIWLAYGKYPCKAELDHFDLERGIVDLKTAASVESFSPMNYLLQQGFYFGGVLEKDMMKYPADLCVVDKHTWSRSHVWRFSIKTLEGVQHTVNKLIERYAECQATGIWRNPDPDTQEGLEILWKSEFWDHCPLSRTSKPTEL